MIIYFKRNIDGLKNKFRLVMRTGIIIDFFKA